ncbi:MAG TPA: hypothetical protein VIP77_12020 [Jiangellaceae bacterium]
MITVSAKALWWSEPKVCDCVAPNEDFECPHDTTGSWPAGEMYVGDIDGRQFITDRYVCLPVERLTQLPVGYGRELNLRPLPRQAAEGFAEWMTAAVLPAPSYRLFQPERIDPLEAAGFKVRELVGVKDAHAICDHGLEVAGLITPIMRSREKDYAGRVAR